MAKVDPDHRALRIHGTIARDLGMKIVNGGYAPGDVLSGEVVASDQLNVSRTAYREALRMLAAKGLVESRPKTGTRVSDRQRWQMLDPDILSWIFAEEPDESLLVSLFELRRIVEPEAASLAARRRTPDQIREMKTALEDMARHSLTSPEGRLADQRFHAALLNASANPFLITLTSGVGAAVAWTTVYKQRKTPLRRDPMPEHWAVFDAVAAGDAAQAHQAMTELVDLAFLDTTSVLPPS
ncbi:FadR/GntR family transcriptional regulator [Sphingomonas sp. BGYR3]|uniref:FadR/GntR family transcriptional regulator n=1 Tax=Sphingomonas sp. BGYR3 TaxID=2975483 RepID=UPI0021A2DD7A|nr:FadR/GntR family transcriptional regulator [Sphingomonas sp. BGYR3]MDG5487198.1 FadR/GntR family transcriptional regulator [Sphingomonas sp. BGYR3]